MSRLRCKAAHLVLALALAVPGRTAGDAGPDDEEARILHALNRLGYGPRPGDVERVRALGLERWIDLQLHPERISDREVPGRLAGLRTVRLSTHDLLKGYEVPREARREIQQRRAELGENPSEAQVRQARRELITRYAPHMEGSPKLVIDELQQAKLLRAIYSERQLDEVLVDFWINHFNVYAKKGPDRFLLGAYERETIRPHAWGRFEDLLRATAESPAMLFYLDNWLSADPNAPAGVGRWGPVRSRGTRTTGSNVQGKGRKRGLNENYARELMELHTLGVDGGYTQKDVTEVARCFTGWTITGMREERPEFGFVDRIHDHGDKVVLGERIRGGGKDEGDRVLHLLATHPSTAHLISLELARRFVSDAPPQALVDRAAQTFLRTGGDIRAVVTTIVTSPEFFAPETRSAKIKTPLELVVSAVRASEARVDDAAALGQRLVSMGMPLYLQQPPTGYKDTADAWVSTSGLLARLNFAIDLGSSKIPGVTPGATRLDPSGLVLGSPEFQRR